MAQVILPELGEQVKKATVTFWFFKVGDTVKENDDLVEMTTDKAAFNVPSPYSGILKEILVNEGDVVQVGTALAVIEQVLPR
ncbi:MAG: biotin/lipoyl-containing protein [Candidatus Omnitrophota bacterium]|jgi:pyruvate/2-oxoglutarate dehydrogenase complex dihydrolipoamide acyltransferase (E2) component